MLSLVTQARLLCGSGHFKRWIDKKKRLVDGCTGRPDAEAWLLKQCKIESLEELTTNHEAAKEFHSICWLFEYHIGAYSDVAGGDG